MEGENFRFGKVGGSVSIIFHLDHPNQLQTMLTWAFQPKNAIGYFQNGCSFFWIKLFPTESHFQILGQGLSLKRSIQLARIPGI